MRYKLPAARRRNSAALVLALALAGACCSRAAAQDSSLLHRWPDNAPTNGLTVENGSLLYKKPQPVKVMQLHDLVTVVVSLKSRMLSEGDAESRRTASINAVLADWIGFDGLSVRPDPQSQGDPKINGQLNTQLRAESDLETRNTLTFTIQAQVVDVRPNGNLVIEARQTVDNNAEVWEKQITGVIRREDVNPDNTISSDNVADLRLYKRERGAVRDGYRRGWITKLYDRFLPF